MSDHMESETQQSLAEVLIISFTTCDWAFGEKLNVTNLFLRGTLIICLWNILFL